MGYHYVKTYEIGLVSATRTPEAVMGMLQAQPNAFFPFNVVGPESIRLGAKYTLTNVKDMRWAPASPGWGTSNPIVVSEVGPTSFSFYTLVGHFDGPNGVVTFTTFARDGFVYLQQEGNAPDASMCMSLEATLGAPVAWQQQADSLASAAQHSEMLAIGEKFIHDQHFGSVTVDVSDDTGSTMVIGPITVDGSGKTDSAKTVGPITVDKSTDTGSTMVIGPMTTGSMTPRGAGQESQTSADQQGGDALRTIAFDSSSTPPGGSSTHVPFDSSSAGQQQGAVDGGGHQQGAADGGGHQQGRVDGGDQQGAADGGGHQQGRVDGGDHQQGSAYGGGHQQGGAVDSGGQQQGSADGGGHEQGAVVGGDQQGTGNGAGQHQAGAMLAFGFNSSIVPYDSSMLVDASVVPHDSSSTSVPLDASSPPHASSVGNLPHDSSSTPAPHASMIDVPHLDASTILHE